MTDERLDSAERDAVTSQPVVEVLSEVDSPPIPVPANAMTVYVTLPPGSAGSAPHRHPGPAFGYVIEGEMIFEVEVEGEPERVVKAGESFWEPGGDVIHYHDGNNLTDAETKFVVVLFGVPGQDVVAPVPSEELDERRTRRASRP